MIAITALQWTGIVIAGLVALAGFGLAAVNLVPILLQKRNAAGERQPIVGAPQQLTRRRFFGRALGIGFSAAMGSFGMISLGFLWPNLRGGFGGKITLAAPADEILSSIRDQRKPYYYAPGRFYLVPYDENNPKADIYTKDGLVSSGLMALYQRCVHLGCRVPWCDTSQWFECPCHGSQYNRAGEWKGGPAPRGLDRFPIEVQNGIVTVDTGLIFTGPPRLTNTTGQDAEGPHCISQGGGEH